MECIIPVHVQCLDDPHLDDEIRRCVTEDKDSEFYGYTGELRIRRLEDATITVEDGPPIRLIDRDLVAYRVVSIDA